MTYYDTLLESQVNTSPDFSRGWGITNLTCERLSDSNCYYLHTFIYIYLPQDCYCGGNEIPGGFSPDQIPQFVLLTFDDAVNDLNEVYTG